MSKERISDLTKLGAECHRTKWQFDLNEEYQPTRAEARALIDKAFYEIDRLGNLALKMRDEVRKTSRAPSPVDAIRALKTAMRKEPRVNQQNSDR